MKKTLAFSLSKGKGYFLWIKHAGVSPNFSERYLLILKNYIMAQKRLLILLLPILISGLNVKSFGQSLYYYSPLGKKNLTLSEDKVFVKFAPALSANDRQKAAAQFQSESNLRNAKVPGELAFLQVNSSLQRLEASQKIDRIRSIPGVKWSSPVLVSSDGEEIAISPKVCVKLKFAGDVMSLQLLAAQYQNAQIRQDEFLPLIYYIELPHETALDILKIANQLMESRAYAWAQPALHMTLKNHSSDDPYYPIQWHLNNTGLNNYRLIVGKADADIDAPEAWAITRGSSTIKIAIIDDGVDLNHPDLKANILPGFDASGRNSGGAPEDNNVHGTACAGVVAAVGNNKIGVTGVAPNCKIIPVRLGIVDPETNSIIGDDVQFARAINWAWKEGKADVLSNSWGGGEFTFVVKEAIDAAVSQGRGGKGCPVLFSSGNFNREVFYPAAYNKTIAVGASNMCDERKRSSNRRSDIEDERVLTDPMGVSCDREVGWGSNYGVNLDIVAPSPSIYTTDLAGDNRGVQGDYRLFNGTSASCPVAAGVMALILSANPNLTEKDARAVLESTCDKAGNYSYANVITQPNGTWNFEMGYGRVNAHQAVLKARNYVSQPGTNTQLTLYSALEVSPNPSYIGTTVTVKFNLANFGTVDFSGTLAVALFDENGDFIEFMKQYPSVSLPANKRFTNDITFEYQNAKPKRRFKIAVFSAATNAASWVIAEPGNFDNVITWLNGYGVNSNCKAPGLIKVSSKGYSHFALSWEAVAGIRSYEIRYRKQGAADWVELPNWSGTTHVSSNKTPCTTYEWQIRSVCSTSVGEWSPVQLIKTDGCGDSYCYSYGVSNSSYIKEVSIGDMTLSSGTDYGYSNNTQSIIRTSAGATLPVRLTPGQSNDESLKEVFWQIWIDYNGDKKLDELVFQKKGDNESVTTGTIAIPSTANGSTRLRVMMALEENVSSCDRDANKEVEDYSIDISPGIQQPNLSISATSLSFVATGESKTFNITSNTAWTIAESLTWLSTSSTSGSNNATITVVCDATTTTTSRTGIISISGTGVATQRITVTQAAGSLSLTVSPTNLAFEPSGGDQTLNVLSSLNWTASENLDWLYLSPSSGSKNGLIIVDCTPNTGSSPRSGVITVSGNGVADQKITVTQSAKTSAELPESWKVNITENNHTIILPSTLQASIEGQALQKGDHVGIFYTRDAQLYCAGAGEWIGTNTSFPVYGDDASTSIKDGLSANELFTVKVWQLANGQEFNAQAEYAPTGTNGIISATDRYSTDAISMITKLNAAKTETLNLALKEGWNTISSYIAPSLVQLDSVFKPIRSSLQIAKDGAGKTYITNPPINSIGTWKITEGYRIKVTGNINLPFVGKSVDPTQTPIPLRTGWQIIPFYSRIPRAVEQALSSINGKIEIVKDNAGKVYIPDLAINTIGQLQATQGYRLKAKTTGELRYPADYLNLTTEDPWAKSSPVLADSLEHFKLAANFNTGSNATLVILKTAGPELMRVGDEIGIFAADSILCGAGKYLGDNLAITVWGDDATETGRQGLFNGEPYLLRIWSQSQNQETKLIADFGSSKGFYQEDDLVLVQSLKLSVVSSIQHILPAQAFTLFPNPSLGSVNLLSRMNFREPVMIRILNMQGQLLYTRKLTQGFSKGAIEQFDLPDLSSGVYQLRLSTDSSQWFGKFSVLK